MLRRAVELGVTLIDTAHAYGPGFNEALIAEALHPYPDGLVITTKCGIAKVGPGHHVPRRPAQGDPHHLRGQPQAARRETIDLLQLHWVDEDTPIEELVGAIADLVRAGKVRHIGISNVTLDEFERARGRHRSRRCRTASALPTGSHEALVDRCAEAGIVFFPYGPLDAQPFARGRRWRRRRPARRRRRERGLHAGAAGAGLAAGAQPGHGADSRDHSLGHLEENVAAAGLRLSPRMSRRSPADRRRCTVRPAACRAYIYRRINTGDTPVFP